MSESIDDECVNMQLHWQASLRLTDLLDLIDEKLTGTPTSKFFEFMINIYSNSGISMKLADFDKLLSGAQTKVKIAALSKCFRLGDDIATVIVDK